VDGAHVGFGLFERSCDAFDYFVHFAHALEFGLQAGVSGFLGVMAVFWTSGFGRWGIVGVGSVILWAGEDVFFVVLQAQASYVGCFCGLWHGC
jgi:hypothetical protein